MWPIIRNKNNKNKLIPWYPKQDRQEHENSYYKYTFKVINMLKYVKGTGGHQFKKGRNFNRQIGTVRTIK